MDALSATASIIAVIQGITACWKVYSSIKDAREDINKLQAQVLSIQELTTRIEALFRGPDGQRLSGSGELKSALGGCNSELQQLRDKLDHGNRQSRTRKLLGIIKTHAKWPFTGPEVFKILNNLERWKQSITLALNIDHVVQLRDIKRKLDFAGLPFAEGAAYGSYSDQHQPECQKGTRVDLLRDISKWVEDPHGKCIFWLSGKAGTGKSTISRTVAKNLRDAGQLGASFFFRRGEKDRGDATKFFTTLASQLANSISDIAPGIQSAIDAEPRIPSMSLREQFNKLIFEPLSQLTCSSTQKTKAVVVIDALDECDREEDEKLIISQLGRLKEIQAVEMRIFLTSRPEVPERLGFEELPGSTYQDIVLHKVPGIEQDIALFLDQQFRDIRKLHSLPDSWPATEDLQRLVEMAVPLFIFAATACRFIGDRKRDPEQRIKIVMEYQKGWRAGKLEQTYFPVLHSLESDELSEPHDTLAADFKTIVGAILTLASPLSIPSLSGLLCIREAAIYRMVDLLHSVLDVPPQSQRNTPIRALHLSFRDFLFDENLRSNARFHHFWIDNKESHRKLYSKCVELMSGSKGLKENICGLSPGALRQEIETSVIESRLSLELQYACRYWVYHLEQSGDSVSDGDMVHKFLQRHVLHWLEAMSLSDDISEMISIVETLSIQVDIEKGKDLSALVQDIRRFVIRNQYIIGMSPLQTYYSAVVFTPKRSIVRGLFEADLEEQTKWAKQLPRVQDDWDGLLQTLHGHTNYVTSVAFSLDGKTVASASKDETVKLWDAATGAALNTLHGHTDSVNSVAFSPNGKIVASASGDGTVRLWDAATGAALNTLHGHTDWVRSVAFSPDGKTVASASEDQTVRLWNAATGATLNTLHGHTEKVNSVVFSSDGKIVASASGDQMVRLWDAATGVALNTLHGHTDWVRSVAFSSDGRTVASASDDQTVRLWDATTGAVLNTLIAHTNMVNSVAFSPDGKTVVSASDDQTVMLWDAATGATLNTLHGHTNMVSGVAFSPDGKTVVSASDDKTVRLWDAATRAALNTLHGHTNVVNSVAFSPDSKTAASASWDGTVMLWDTATGAALNTLHGHADCVNSVVFSPNGKIVASASDDETVTLWDVVTGAALNTLDDHVGCANSVVFSPDDKIVASALDDGTVRLWDAATGVALNTLHGHTDRVRSVVFSPNGKIVASSSDDETVTLWDAATGVALNTLHGHTGRVKGVAFSPDGKIVASALDDKTVRLWDAATGAALKTLHGHTNMINSLALSPDSKTVASASDDETVGLQDAATGAGPSVYNNDKTASNLRFSEDGQYLHTDRGSFSIPQTMDLALHSPHHTQDLHQGLLQGLLVDDEWLIRGGKRLLWLPPDYRPSCSAVADDTICTGHASGEVSFFTFAT